MSANIQNYSISTESQLVTVAENQFVIQSDDGSPTQTQLHNIAQGLSAIEDSRLLRLLCEGARREVDGRTFEETPLVIKIGDRDSSESVERTDLGCIVITSGTYQYLYDSNNNQLTLPRHLSISTIVYFLNLAISDMVVKSKDETGLNKDVSLYDNPFPGNANLSTLEDPSKQHYYSDDRPYENYIAVCQQAFHSEEILNDEKNSTALDLAFVIFDEEISLRAEALKVLKEDFIENPSIPIRNKTDFIDKIANGVLYEEVSKNPLVVKLLSDLIQSEKMINNGDDAVYTSKHFWQTVMRNFLNSQVDLSDSDLRECVTHFVESESKNDLAFLFDQLNSLEAHPFGNKRRVVIMEVLFANFENTDLYKDGMKKASGRKHFQDDQIPIELRIQSLEQWIRSAESENPEEQTWATDHLNALAADRDLFPEEISQRLVPYDDEEL